MLSIQTVKPDTLELLKAIFAQPEIQELRLVGGTSLALQYGHRQSIDLDFFGRLPEDMDVLIDVVRRVGDVTVLNRSKIILQMVPCLLHLFFVSFDPLIHNPPPKSSFLHCDARSA